MKKIDLGQTIGILANVGVIVGIVALVIETFAIERFGSGGTLQKDDKRKVLTYDFPSALGFLECA